MPLPIALIAAGLTAAGSVASSAISNSAAGKAAKRAQAQNERMFWLQEMREDVKWKRQNEHDQMLWEQQNRYNEHLWNKQNQYNSPAAQMARFKEAGLNPALIYGQSNAAPGIATAQFGRSAAAKGTYAGTPFHKPDYGDFGIGQAMSTYMNFRESDARTNNLEAQNDVLKMEAAKKAVETSGIAIGNARSKLDLETATALQNTSIQAAEAQLRKTNLEMDLSLRRDEREAALNVSSLSEAAHRIALMRGQRISQELDIKLKQLDIELRQYGINPGDPTWMRVLGRLFERGADKILNNILD